MSFISNCNLAAGEGVEFLQSSQTIDRYDMIEITLKNKSPRIKNPFTDVKVSGIFTPAGGKPIPVDGFCDASDGSVHRIRFMPSQSGKYSYRVTYHHQDTKKTHSGTFQVRHGRRRGLVRVDKDYPWHFLWEGTGEHYFWNATTTYFLMSCDDEIIRESIDRLHRLKVNRLRVVISGRVKDGIGWCENVYPSKKISYRLNPWVAERPDSVEDPGYDVKRFNLAYWQKWDRMLRYANERDMIISAIFYLSIREKGVNPFKQAIGKEDEQRYYHYAVARFAAFSNVMWDLANEYRHFHKDEWAEKMGTLLKQYDPYDHLVSIHGHVDFRFHKSPWVDFAMYQKWDERGGYHYMLCNRRMQEQTGRIIPQVNEEYGYESHYPTRWGGNRRPPARIADNCRRLAWEIYMAGCYQTTGERAETKNGWPDKAGGGWINGRGDDSMEMLKGYGYIVDFFKTCQWWKTKPSNELVSKGALCLAQPNKLYIVYLPTGGDLTIFLRRGAYHAKWYNPRTGKFVKDYQVQHKGRYLQLKSPNDTGDMVLKLVPQK